MSELVCDLVFRRVEVIALPQTMLYNIISFVPKMEISCLRHTLSSI